jgi:integrase
VITLDLSEKYMKNIMGASFRALIRDAKIDDRIDRSPFDELPNGWWPKAKKQKIDPFTGKERDQILAYYRQHRPREYPFVYSRFWIGAMRPSEAVALKWRDIDLQTHTIDIRDSRYLGAEDDTKSSASERTVELMLDDEDVLRKIMPLRVNPKTHVFLDEKGRPIDQSEFNRLSFQDVLRILEIRPRPFYNTRHSWISLNLTEGSNPQWVCEQSGTSLAMLAKHYGKYMKTNGGQHLRAYRTRQKAQIA